MSKPTTAERKIVRDIRIERIGLVEELKKHFTDDLRTGVKLSLVEKGANVAESEHFEGLLVQSERSTIDPAKWLKLYTDGLITRKQFLGALTVVNKAAYEILTPPQIARISSTTPGEPQLRITRKTGPEFEIGELVRRLSAEFSGPE